MDKLQLQEQRNKYNTLLNSTKKDYIKNKIENAESSKDLHKIWNKLLNREQKAILPSHDFAQSLANTVVNYFNEKIELIRNKIQTVFPYFVVSPSNNSSVIFEADIRKIMSSSPTKSCALAPHPYMATQTMPRPTGTCSYNYCKYLTIMCWISNWTKEGFSYPSYQENNPWLWNFQELQSRV